MRKCLLFDQLAAFAWVGHCPALCIIRSESASQTQNLARLLDFLQHVQRMSNTQNRTQDPEQPSRRVTVARVHAAAGQLRPQECKRCREPSRGRRGLIPFLGTKTKTLRPFASSTKQRSP